MGLDFLFDAVEADVPQLSESSPPTGPGPSNDGGERGSSVDKEANPGVDMHFSPALAAARVARLRSSTSSRLLWKSYAIALQAHLTTQDDLDRSSKAIFVASPGLYDVPSGKFVPQEVANDRLFRRADPIQDGRAPFYTSDGESYFKVCQALLSHVHDDATHSGKNCGYVSRLREDVETAQQKSEQAYLKDLDLYNRTASVAPTGLSSFEAWLAKFGIFYTLAAEEQKRLELEYTLAASKSLNGVGLALAALDLAGDTKKHWLGSNMPCVDLDIPSSVGGGTGRLEIKPSDIYYRPLYSINGIDRRIDSWVEEMGNKETTESIYIGLDLENAKKVPWASLGYPDLDRDPTYNTDVTNASTSDIEISLTVSGMQAFDVDRGFWDINAAARPQLDAVTDNSKNPLRKMKTTRVLLAYGAELRIKSKGDRNILPSTLLDANNKSSSILGISVGSYKPDTKADDDEQVMIASGPTGFPALLAVLAREV